MARPTKQGIDYFPLDVYLDDKFRFIEIKFGTKGFGVIIKLFQKIYANGFWYKWTGDEKLLFTGELFNVNINEVNDIINEAIERNIFDKEMYKKYEILTSKGIQRRYFEATKRRKEIEVIKEYVLIDNINGINANINFINVCNNQQSKVNKSKENKSKENNISIVDKIDYKSIVDYLNSKCNTNYRHTTKSTREKIKARFNEGFTYDDFKTVIDKKANEWLNTDMAKYLRPETLFGNKFESYLNQQIKRTSKTMIDLDDVDIPF